MIWAKTDAGRVEMQAKGLVKERPLRNLLLLIDGHKSEEMLLANVAGITAADFSALEAMGLIERVQMPARASSRSSASTSSAAPSPSATPAPAPPSAEPQEMDYPRFTEALTQLIAKDLGLRGFTLTLALEKASTPAELKDVAERAIEQIRERKGVAAAEQARRALFGG